MKIHRLRRTFHHRGPAANLDRLTQETLHVCGFGRCAIRFASLFAQTIFDRARHGHRFAGSFRN